MISPSTEPKVNLLSPSERIHLDIYGYVVIENVLSKEEIETSKAAMYQIEEEFHRTNEKPSEEMFFTSTTRDYFRIDNLPHLSPCFRDYVTSPKIVGYAEEAVGGSVRLEQSDAHIRRYENKRDTEYSWHRGFDPAFCYRSHGLFHCPFVKCLTNLTDLGPDDGGTTVIAGSHKMADIPIELLKQAVAERPNLRHQVVAPAGSTLVFYESTMHSSGISESCAERLLILGGYAPDFFQTWWGYEADAGFVESQPEDHRPFYTGAKRYKWTPLNRDLSREV